MTAKSEIISKIINTICILFIISIIFIYSAANINHFTRYMDADIASVTLQSTLIYENGYSTPDTWYISMEKFIISPQNLAAFIYPLTHFNMNLSMGIACTIMMSLMLIAMFVFLSINKFTMSERLISLLVLLMLCSPGSETHHMLFLYAGYYTSHFITMFVILSVYSYSLKKGHLSIPAILCTLALSIVNGMQGMHAALFCYTPLLGTEIIRRFTLFIRKQHMKSDNIISIWCILLTFISIGVTHLSDSYNLGPSRNIRHAPEKFFKFVLPEFCRVLSFDRFPLLVGIICVMGIIGYIIIIKRIISASNFHIYSNYSSDYSTLPILFGLIICVLSTTFTTAEAASRYYIMELFIISIGTAAFIHNYNFKKWIYIIYIPFFMYGILSIFSFKSGLLDDDKTSETAYGRIASWMEANNLEYGYSIFDHANTITVISNNAVKIRALADMNSMTGCKWLTDTRWYPPVKSPDTYTCYIVSPASEADFNKFLDREHPEIIEIQSFDIFTIYVLSRDYSIWID